MTFLKFCAFVTALSFLKSLIFGFKQDKKMTGKEAFEGLATYFSFMYLTYWLLNYSGNDVIEFFKTLI